MLSTLTDLLSGEVTMNQMMFTDIVFFEWLCGVTI